MPPTVYEYTAPSLWASYLLNGDGSGLSDAERAQADAWLAWVDKSAPVSCEPAGFKWRHDASQLGVLGTDCETYTFLD